MAAPLTGKTIALVVTGSIAAYKAVEVARLAIKSGAKVIPVMTKSAQKFVGAATLAGICGERVYDDMWDQGFDGEMHIAIANRADAIVIVPATADLLARLAQGRADDLVTALVLSAKGPVFVVPAMHPRMWSNAATARNVAMLRSQSRLTFVGPVEGEVASGERGVGRMVEPAAIFEALASGIAGRKGAGSALLGKHMLISAGPTVEDLDPVRFIGNRSSGKMGFSLAEAALARGAKVTLVAGPVALTTPQGAHRIDVRSALEMRAAIQKMVGDDLKGVDAIVMCAAVADYRAKEISTSKTKKPSDGSADEISISLVKNPDILAEIGALRGARKSPVLVGFAVETGDDTSITSYAQKKLAQKSVDLIVANAAAESFGKDDNRAILVGTNSVEALPTQSKRTLADAIVDRLVNLLGSTS
ncbi:MAG: bifunctional phosphopantothenoylcysteine decarboxylase/phosphopantothenate--cysteine ligase CoaBC [Polyangiaceae bacterium]